MPERWVISEDLRRRMIEVARAFRKEPTRGEDIMWHELRGGKLHARFRREQPLGPFVVDFFCAKCRLIVEVDGTIHDDPAVQEADRMRQSLLEEVGFRFCRVRTELVETDPEAAVEIVRAAMEQLPGVSRAR